MKKLLLFILLFTALGFKAELFAQSEPVLYFCVHYDRDNGEVGVSDHFIKGHFVTVMVKCDKPLGLDKVHIQFDKYNYRTGQFDYYKRFGYSVEKDMNYIFFSKKSDNDLKFEDAGFYRVFLLDNNNNTVASALVEITD